MRLFAGLPVPQQDRLDALGRSLKRGHPDLRLVPAGSHHVTLRFFGDIEGQDAVGRLGAALAAAAAGHPAMPAQVRGLGAFPDAGDARIVWADVRAKGIRALAETVRNDTALFGKPPEPRPFKPHVTIGRMKIGGDLRMDVGEYGDTIFGTGILDRIVLWRSDPGPSGPVYTQLHEWPLAPG